MKEYVMLPCAILEDSPELQGWVHRSLAYGRSLPVESAALKIMEVLGIKLKGNRSGG